MWKIIITLNIVSLLLIQTLATPQNLRVMKGKPRSVNKNETLANVRRSMPIKPITDSPLIITSSIDEFIQSSSKKKSLSKKNFTTTSTTTTTSSSTTTTTTTPATTTTTTRRPTTVSPLELQNTTSTTSLTSPTAVSSSESPYDPYCIPSLCQFYNGTDIQVLPHIACHNPGNFAPTCGFRPHLLHMNNRRRNLILALHNLARSKVASGNLPGYLGASHMPLLRWDSELERLATLHVKRCHFSHDQCRNTLRFAYSGQNIGYYWIERDITSYSRRMKNFIVSWFKEYLDANQTFVDAFQMHPEGKQIGHFTQMVADRAHKVGCAAIHYREPNYPTITRFLMTCNYDFTNIYGEPIYQSGPSASKCLYKTSDKFPALCDWKEPVYEYENNNVDTEGYGYEALDNDIGDCP
ncbi:venom allergen-1-like [Haematobia irritans]|uniref:venom allergen-1-like n=1 Tax=Haematobia irritans TaxID=7368 RepID=UPI003F4FE946